MCGIVMEVGPAETFIYEWILKSNVFFIKVAKTINHF